MTGTHISQRWAFWVDGSGFRVLICGILSWETLCPEGALSFSMPHKQPENRKMLMNYVGTSLWGLVAAASQICVWHTTEWIHEVVFRMTELESGWGRGCFAVYNGKKAILGLETWSTGKSHHSSHVRPTTSLKKVDPVASHQQSPLGQKLVRSVR